LFQSGFRKMPEDKHWRSQIKVLQVKCLEDLESAVNEFCKDKFVVGIQYPDAMHVDSGFTAIVSYKILEE